MIVYGSSLSPFVRKVLAFAAEKGIELELKPTGLGNKDPEFLEASPFGKMPGFRDGDFAISDSSAIIAYLEAVQPEPNLIPTEPKARARTIWYDEFADTILFACGGKMFFNRLVGAALPRPAGRRGGRGQGRVRGIAASARLSGAGDPGERLPGRGPADPGRHRGGEPVRQPAAHPRRPRSGPPSQGRRLCRGDPRPAELQALDRPRGRLPEPRRLTMRRVAEIASFHAHVYFEDRPKRGAEASPIRRRLRSWVPAFAGMTLKLPVNRK